MKLVGTTLLQSYIATGMAVVAITIGEGVRWQVFVFIFGATLIALILRALLTKRMQPEIVRVKLLCNRKNAYATGVVCALCVAALVAGEFSESVAELKIGIAIALFVSATSILFGYLLARRYRSKRFDESDGPNVPPVARNEDVKL